MGRDRTAVPEAKPLRLFVAVDISAEAKDALAAAVHPFTDRIPGARWTGTDSWHVTVKFLGTTWPRLVEEVRAKVGEVATRARAFETRLTALGVFPSPRRARVLWTGLEDPQGRFAEVVKALDEALAEDFEPEDRPFTPHLTVARLAPPRDLAEFASDLVGARVDSKPFPVDRLVLYRSHLSPRGARYESLLSAPFGR